MLTVFFGVEKVENFEMAKKSNLSMFKKFAEYMITNGIYIPSSQFEAMFLSSAHTESDIERFAEVAEGFAKFVKKP